MPPSQVLASPLGEDALRVPQGNTNDSKPASPIAENVCRNPAPPWSRLAPSAPSDPGLSDLGFQQSKPRERTGQRLNFRAWPPQHSHTHLA